MGLEDILQKIPPVVRGYGAGLLWAGSINALFPGTFQQHPELFVATYAAGCLVGFIESHRYGARAAAHQLNIRIQVPANGIKQALKEHAPTVIGAATMIANLALMDASARHDLYWADEGFRHHWDSLKIYRDELKRIAELQANKVPISWLLGLGVGTMAFVAQEICAKGLMTSMRSGLSFWRYFAGDRILEQWYDGWIIGKDPEYGVEATAWALKRGKYAKAFSYARRAIEAQKVSHRNYLALNELGSEIQGTLTPEQTLKAALCSYVVGDKQRALEILENSDEDITTKVLTARVARALGDREKAREYLGRAATKMISDDAFRLERRGESTNPVFFVENPYFGELVLFKQSPRDDIPKQRQLLEESRRALAPLKNVELSDLVETVEVEERTLGVWEMIKGRTLYDLAREDPHNAFPYVREAARATGLLLGGLPSQGILPDMRKKIHARVLKVAQSVQDFLSEAAGSLADRAAESADPILESYSWVPEVRRMDRHLENYLASSKPGAWWTKERIIGVIDFDVANDPVPLSCESANLLAYVPVFSEAQVHIALEEMEEWFNRGSSTPLVKGALQRAHPLGVMQRGIDLNGAWSTQSRRSLWSHRHQLWSYAHRQIGMVHRDDPIFFKAYARQFNGLDHVFGVIGLALKTYDGKQTLM